METLKEISLIIPAYNEEDRLKMTLSSLQEVDFCHELIVVDDGSQDNTAPIAREYADKVICHSVNKGKGEALYSGYVQSEGNVLMFLDADLGTSVKHCRILLQGIIEDRADMMIANLPVPGKKGGFGLVRGLASMGIRSMTGFRPVSPLSGQRAVKREVIGDIAASFSSGFGIEVGMTIDTLKAGYRVVEVDVPFLHRTTGRDITGFLHRGKQFVSVSRALCRRWEGVLWKQTSTME